MLLLCKLAAGINTKTTSTAEIAVMIYVICNVRAKKSFFFFFFLKRSTDKLKMFRRFNLFFVFLTKTFPEAFI